jgi:hypothetical protein
MLFQLRWRKEALRLGILEEAARLLSRRVFLRALAGATLARAHTAGEPARPDRLDWSLDKTPGLSLERRYRADAQVVVFGMSLLHREGVGGGSVRWREFEAGGATRLLEFSGFSTPERAAGLDRLGFIREMARTSEKGGPQSIYFGLMTASPEESAEAARKALRPAAKEQVYTAIDGRIGAGKTETAIVHFTAPASLSGEHRAELLERARRALAPAERIAAAGVTRESSHSFLEVLAGLLPRPDGAEGRYIYSGRPYRIWLARSVDNTATAHFRERGLIAHPAQVLRVSGKVRREAGGKETEFRLWIPAGSERPLPLRIEYQARSYLRLVFEAQAG